MLDNLTRRLTGIFSGLRKKGRLTEDDVNAMLREVRVALLEADVNFQVAKDFMKQVKEKAVGEDVFASLTADQTIIKIVRDELIELLGTDVPMNWGSAPPTVVLMCGLQGSGKTTTTAKLAKWFLKQGKKPMLAACDLQRPAAIKQLQVLGQQVGVPVFTPADMTNPDGGPVEVAKQAIEKAKYLFNDVVILDTAGRLTIDEALMDELEQIRKVANPQEVLLVLDSTTGQEAVTVAEHFHGKMALTGAIFSKMDGDTRGGAILSVRAATSVPVRFLGVGEATDALEQFFPDRLAGRIIGMGDVLGIIEKAEEAFQGEDMASMEQKMRSGKFDFNDMLNNMRMMRKMGPIKNVIKMVPGLSSMVSEEDLDKVNERDVYRFEAIVLSMTPKERSNPDILNGSRRKRIARGSGTSQEEVNRLIDQLYQMRRNMKQLSQMEKQFKKMGKRR